MIDVSKLTERLSIQEWSGTAWVEECTAWASVEYGATDSAQRDVVFTVRWNPTVDLTVDQRDLGKRYKIVWAPDGVTDRDFRIDAMNHVQHRREIMELHCVETIPNN